MSALKKSQELVETLTDISVQVEKMAPVASKLAVQLKKATKFVVRCFRCQNAERTERELLDETIQVRKTRNVYQVKGTCACCNETVTGFLPTATATKLAADRNLPIIVLPPKEKAATKTPPKRVRKEKRPASEMDVVVDEVGAVEPNAKENKQ